MLVVVNQRSAISERVGEYYRAARAVPREHVVRIRTEPREEIDRATYRREIAEPVATHLARHRLQDQVLAIVLTKGVPLKIRGTGGPTGTQASVDSELTLLYRAMVQGAPPVEGRLPNPYFHPTAPVPFSRADSDVYLVTRLDGYRWEDIRGLIDRAASPARRGKVIIDLKGAFPGTGSDTGNRWLREAAERLKDSGTPVLLHESGPLVTGEADVIGYAGWGSNDPADRRRSPGLRWVPGAIASWFVSTSARTFLSPPAGWTTGSWQNPKSFFAGSPQSLIGDLVAEGVTGAVGFVYEPYLDATARPQVLLPAYRAGFTLAESFYMALPHLSWQAVVIGDPLVAPFEPPATARPAPPPGRALFLQRRASALEAVVARASAPESVQALTLTYVEQARELMSQRRLDEALLAARRAATLKPDEPLALYTLGAVHAMREERDEAEAAFRTLLRLAPDSAPARDAERWLAR